MIQQPTLQTTEDHAHKQEDHAHIQEGHVHIDRLAKPTMKGTNTTNLRSLISIYAKNVFKLAVDLSSCKSFISMKPLSRHIDPLTAGHFML